MRCLSFQELENALNKFGDKWEYNHGDGAFYGPKVNTKLIVFQISVLQTSYNNTCLMFLTE